MASSVKYFLFLSSFFLLRAAVVIPIPPLYDKMVRISLNKDTMKDNLLN